MDLLGRFARHLSDGGHLEGAGCVVVACSGGGDSTALLLLLHDSLRNQSHASPRILVAAHVAHGLRGESGERDALSIAHLSRRLDLPFALRPIDVAGLKNRGESLEAASRRFRYGSLMALAKELGPGTRIATGHTLDDQAETVLLNLHRHSGRTRGGIRPIRRDGVVRPLLPFKRAELREFLVARGISWREDETNENEAFERNRIRHRLLPELEARMPGASARLARAAEAWTRRLDEMDRLLEAELSILKIPISGPFPRLLFLRLPVEACARLLVRAAGYSGAVPGGMQLRTVLARLRDPKLSFEENLAGMRLKADARAVRLLAMGKTALGTRAARLKT